MAATHLQTALDQLDAEIARLTGTTKPDYSMDGESIQWNTYLKDLLERRQKLVELINGADPYDIRIHGRIG